MSKLLKILIVEDHLGFAEGMELLLLQHPRIEQVYIANTFEKALDELKKATIDIVILDLHFETDAYDGFIIAKKVKQQYPNIKIMILTQHARKNHYKRLFEDCKVDAYLDKKLGVKETYNAIEAVMQGKTYSDHSILKMLEIEEWMEMTKREKEVIALLSKGLTQKEIADQLFVVPKTVEAHIRKLLTKFEVKNSVELIAKYVKYKSANRENIGGSIPPFKNI